MIKAVVFDLDNTLIDFMRMKKISCEAAINAMIDAGLSVDKEKAMKLLFRMYDRYGLEEQRIFQKFLTEIIGDVDYKILASGIVAYRKVRAGFLEPYPHVNDILFKLKSMEIKLAILSDAPRLKAWLRLASMKLTNFFDIVVTFDDTKVFKPDSLPFKAVLKKIGLNAEECLMVGDRPERDVKGANEVGMKTCFARYGNPDAKKTNADYEINNITELMDIIKKDRNKENKDRKKTKRENA